MPLELGFGFVRSLIKRLWERSFKGRLRGAFLALKKFGYYTL